MLTLGICLMFIAIFLFVCTLLFIGTAVVVDKVRDRRVDLLAHREICKLNQMFYTIDIEGVTYVPREFDRGLCTSTPVYRCELAYYPDSAGGYRSSDCSGADRQGVVQGS